jgi:hypothetical protein
METQTQTAHSTSRDGDSLDTAHPTRQPDAFNEPREDLLSDVEDPATSASRGSAPEGDAVYNKPPVPATSARAQGPIGKPDEVHIAQFVTAARTT